MLLLRKRDIVLCAISRLNFWYNSSMKTSMYKTLMVGLVACAAITLFADISLDGSWEFRFEEGKSAEEAFAADFVATDTMTVPGCFDMMPKWLMGLLL